LFNAVSSIAFASSWNAGEKAVAQSLTKKDMSGVDVLYAYHDAAGGATVIKRENKSTNNV
jgi:uncharacterized membrane protein